MTKKEIIRNLKVNIQIIENLLLNAEKDNLNVSYLHGQLCAFREILMYFGKAGA